MIQTIPPYAADHTFHIRILPGAARRSEHFFDIQACDPLLLEGELISSSVFAGLG
jgi:hypothetical protein